MIRSKGYQALYGDTEHPPSKPPLIMAGGNYCTFKAAAVPWAKLTESEKPL